MPVTVGGGRVVLTCLQARLHQAESLIHQQRLTIDKLYSQQGRNSRLTIPAGHMRQSENDYWRSWLQSSADCTAGEDRHHHQALPTSPANCPVSMHASEDAMQPAVSQEAGVSAAHVAGFSAPHIRRNSVAGSSTTSSRNARQHQQKQKRHQAVLLSSNASLANVMRDGSGDDCAASGCHSCGWKPG